MTEAWMDVVRERRLLLHPGGPFKSFRLTPGGTIVSLAGRPLKPETDPDWEERLAAHKAKRQRGSPNSSRSCCIHST